MKIGEFAEMKYDIGWVYGALVPEILSNTIM
jgi:hypothetical protein